MSTKFRNYSFADRQACITLFKSNMPKFFDPTELPLFERFLDALEKGETLKSTHSDGHYYVLLDDETIVGCGGIALNENTSVSMTWGMVDNSLHKKGFGKMLLEYRIEKAKELFPGIEIRLDTTQHSEGFFARLGFKTWKVTKDFYAPGMDRYDMTMDGRSKGG